MNVFYKIVTVVISVCIPVILLCSAFNIAFRLPDLYVYEFNKNQVVREVDLGITDDELGHFFSDFMKGKEENFDLFTEYRDREQSVFGTAEQINMEHIRGLLNKSLLAAMGAALLTVLGYALLLGKKRKSQLRGAYKGSIFVFMAETLLLYGLFYFEQTKEMLYGMVFIYPFGADDVLPLMLTEQFARIGLVAVSVIGLILLVILASVTWRLTKPRRMFW